MTLVQLSYIVAVAKFKSFAAASKKCFVTQPTLSMQIQKLENELGTLIFDRSKQPVQPTYIGQKIIDQAHAILREKDRIFDIIQRESNEVKGTFKLGIIPTISPYLLPLFIENFSKKYPSLVLRINELQTDQIIEKLKNDELDAAIVATPLHSDQLIERPIYYEPFVGYVSKNHRLAKEKTIKPEQLEMNDLFLLKEGHCFRDHVLQICKYYGSHNESVLRSVSFEGGTLDTLMKLVDKNLGMTLIPYLAVKELKGTRRIKSIRYFENPVPKREISIVYHRAYLKKQIIDILEEEITKCLPEELLNKEQSFVLDRNKAV